MSDERITFDKVLTVIGRKGGTKFAAKITSYILEKTSHKGANFVSNFLLFIYSNWAWRKKVSPSESFIYDLQQGRTGKS